MQQINLGSSLSSSTIGGVEGAVIVVEDPDDQTTRSDDSKARLSDEGVLLHVESRSIFSDDVPVQNKSVPDK